MSILNKDNLFLLGCGILASAIFGMTVRKTRERAKQKELERENKIKSSRKPKSHIKGTGVDDEVFKYGFSKPVIYEPKDGMIDADYQDSYEAFMEANKDIYKTQIDLVEDPSGNGERFVIYDQLTRMAYNISKLAAMNGIELSMREVLDNGYVDLLGENEGIDVSFICGNFRARMYLEKIDRVNSFYYRWERVTVEAVMYDMIVEFEDSNKPETVKIPTMSVRL